MCCVCVCFTQPKPPNQTLIFLSLTSLDPSPANFGQLRLAHMSRSHVFFSSLALSLVFLSGGPSFEPAAAESTSSSFLSFSFVHGCPAHESSPLASSPPSSLSS